MTHKRRWILGAGIFTALALAAAPWTLAGDSLRREIARQASDITGLQVEATGPIVFALLPRPRVKVEGFQASGGAISISADFLRGDLRMLPMIAGRAELENLSLAAPRFDVNLDEISGMLAKPAVPADETPAGSGLTPLAQASRSQASVFFIHGSARLHSAARDWSADIDDINMAVNRRGLAQPFTARGVFNWRGEAVQTALWLGPPAPSSSNRAPVVAKFDSPSLAASIDGAMGVSGPFDFEGAIAAKTTSLAGLISSLGMIAPDLSGLGGFSMKAAAVVDAKGLSLSDAKIEIAGASFDGAVSLMTDGARPKFSGTLAAEFVDLTPLAGLLPPLRSPDGQWSGQPLPSSPLDWADVDLRLSATRTRFGRFEIGGAGLSLLANSAHAEASLANASAYGGNLRGRLSADRIKGAIGYLGEVTADNIDAGALLAAARRASRLTGRASGQINLSSDGGDIAALIAGLHGAARINVRDGELGGLDMEQALRRLERRPLSIASELRGGKTSFGELILAIGFDRGVARFDRVEATGLGVDFDVTGSANLSTRDLALRLRAWPASPPPPSATLLSMEIKGPWDMPSVVIDSQSLIERSQAAAPLWSKSEAAPAAAAARQ